MRIPPPAIFLTGVVVGVLLQNRFLPLSIALDPVLLLVAASVVGIVSISLLGLALAAHLRSGQNPEPWKSTPEVLTQGVYRWTRNPMYLGMALAQIALGVGLANAWMLILVPVTTFAVYHFAIRAEETYLSAKFGSDYDTYKQQVRRWF